MLFLHTTIIHTHNTHTQMAVHPPHPPTFYLITPNTHKPHTKPTKTPPTTHNRPPPRRAGARDPHRNWGRIPGAQGRVHLLGCLALGHVVRRLARAGRVQKGMCFVCETVCVCVYFPLDTILQACIHAHTISLSPHPPTPKNSRRQGGGSSRSKWGRRGAGRRRRKRKSR